MKLTDARPVAMITTSNRAVAEPFYEQVLGLTRTPGDPFAAVYDSGGVTLRLTEVPGFAASQFPVLGWNVTDIVAVVTTLAEKGVTMARYDFLDQDELGIWTSPDGSARVAFFTDPDGNSLSLTQA